MTSDRGLPMHRRVSALRAGAHVLAWLPFVFAAARSVATGWRPVSDNAAIALRSWDVLTAHAPLVGQATRLAGCGLGPGPPPDWLPALALPVGPPHRRLGGAAPGGLGAGPPP